MIEFKGYISGAAEKHFHKKDRGRFSVLTETKDTKKTGDGSLS